MPPPLQIPTYRAEVPLFAALPAQLRQADLAMLGSLHQRTGGDADGAGSAAAAQGGGRRAWGRVIRTGLRIGQEGTVSPSSSGQLSGFQAGTDLWRASQWRSGVYVGQLQGDAKVSGFARGVADLHVGGNDLKSQHLGLYATYANSTGFYADAVLQTGRYSYTVAPLQSAGRSGKGHGWLASLEVGQSFDLGPGLGLGLGGWKIEPQLQLVRQSQRLNDTVIPGAAVQQATADGWRLRAGLTVKGELDTRAGSLRPYARLDVHRAPQGRDVTRFVGAAATTDIVTRTGATATEIAAGAVLQLSPATSLYGELGTLLASGADQRVKGGRSVQGAAGVRARW